MIIVKIGCGKENKKVKKVVKKIPQPIFEWNCVIILEVV